MYKIFIYIPGTHKWIREAQDKDLLSYDSRKPLSEIVLHTVSGAEEFAKDNLPTGTTFFILKCHNA